MSIIFGINDIKYKFNGKIVKEFRIAFRKKLDIPNGVSSFKLSELINYKIVQHKDKFICYCDGFIVNTVKPQQVESKKTVAKTTVDNSEEEREEILEDIELEFDNLRTEQKHDLLEEREEYYQKEKKRWASVRSKNERLKGAIFDDYECDNEYCIDRMNSELPGFMLVDHTTLFYKQTYPSELALKIENRFKKRFMQDKDLYGTYTRIALLESHNGNKYDYVECIIIFNYLFKFEVIAIIDELNKELYV